MIVFYFLVTVFTCATTANFTDNLYLYLSENNSLWTSLITKCSQDPSMKCVEKNMFTYLRDTLEYPHDYTATPFLKFSKNKIDFEQIAPNKTEVNEEEEERSTLEEMSRSLHDKSVKFLMTHDYELQLPEAFFQGAVLKLSPRSYEEDGAMLKFELVPRAEEGRILFKKIKNYISEKLIFAFLAILLVIKLLAAKFMFFLPMMVGAVTAKKLLIKVLLFLFPVLHHVFKLCAFAPHGGKIHHHKHHIAHIHHIGHGHHHGHHGHHEPVEVIAPHSEGPPDFHGHGHGHEEHDDGPHWHPPSLHHHVDVEPPHKQFYNPHEQELEYYSGGPALSHHFINHRQDGTDENEVQPSPWGQGDGGKKKSGGLGRPLTSTEIENMVLKAEKEALIKARLQQERLKIQQENIRLQEQLKQAMRLQGKLKQQTALVKNRLEPKLSPPPPPNQFVVAPPPQQQQKTQLQVAKQQLLQQQALQQQQEAVAKQQKQQEAIARQQAQQKQQEAVARQQLLLQKQQEVAKQPLATYDAFYSPILDKIDKILIGLNFNEEPCRERLICSMYKNPPKFSPHSNLLSAELSRDSKDLQKPTNTNAAVIRFYRYVQAARDGQDKRDCLRLYPACAVNTEK